MISAISDTLSRESGAFVQSYSPVEIAAFDSYAAELKKWNSKVNLTAIIKDSEIAIKHFIDSLALLPHVSEGDRLLDIGSGAGLPVIPLKIMRPGVPMVSVDAVAKKIHFQRHVIRMLNLQNMDAVHARVETLPETHGVFSVITSRAFTRLDRFVSLAAPLLADDGIMIAMKGEQALGEISVRDDDVQAHGFEIISVQHYSLPRGMGERVLTFIKRRKTL